ncbi:MAG TPA: DUF4124 domain-containing protein [Burkholderiaceae bacterium]|nr:DUF4124 domain-containing protein [Burkholderiaceae bacterium]
MIWNIRRISLAVVAGLLMGAYALPAVAQWAWRDEAGRTVYSDQPPPANIKGDQILRQPNAQTFGNAGNANPAADGKGDGKDAGKSAPKTLAEREMEFRKRMQENADAEKKAAEDQARNDARAAECERMRGYMKALEEGQRIARTDAQGNREILDDEQRSTEIQRLRDTMSRGCS